MATPCNTKQAPKPSMRNGTFATHEPLAGIASLKRAAEVAADSKSQEFAHKVRKLTDEGHLSLRTIGNIKAYQDALKDVVVPTIDAQTGRAIQSTAFNLLSGNLMVAGVNEAYQAVPTVGEQLTRQIDDPKKVTHFAGIISEDDTAASKVAEGKPFPLFSASEERYDVGHNRNGARIAVTQEMIDENDIAGILQRINFLGEWAGETIENRTLDKVLDIDSDVYQPNGSASALYVSSNAVQDRVAATGNRLTNTGLADTDSLNTARKQLAQMKNSRGEPILVGNEVILLVPDALLMTAWKLTRTDTEPGTFSDANFFGPGGQLIPRLISTPRLDLRYTNGSTSWHMGVFNKQFVRKWKTRPETVVLPGSTEGARQSFLDARIGFQARVAWDCEIGATDQGVYVVQCLAGTSTLSRA